jgi:hypothetical protein
MSRCASTVIDTHIVRKRISIPGDGVGADFSVSSATERLVMVAGAALISQRAIKLGVDPTVFTGA